MKKTLVLIIAISALALGFGIGCKDKKTTAATPGKPGAKPVAAAPAAPAPLALGTTPTPEAAGEGEQPPLESAYTYNPIREDGKPKRNPFQPISVPVGSAPIMMYEISQLGVNGIILHGVKTASVVTPDCDTVFVKVGDKIGVHDGSVVDITLEGVLVRESYLDIRGRIQEYERLIPNQPFGCKGQ